MSSENEVPELASIERLFSSRSRDLSLLLPFILGFTPRQDSGDPDQQTPESNTPREPRDRIVLINPLTQGMVVIEGSSSNLDSLFRDLAGKDGQPPASKSSIEAMESVEIRDGDEEGECVICLDEWDIGGVVKEMPCKHRFHSGCIEKWLGIHGSCPVCRYKMPVDDADDELPKMIGGGGAGRDGAERGRRREIWVSFSFSGRGSDENTNQTASGDSGDSSPTTP